MKSIFLKELNIFFAGPIGYFVIGLFWLFSGLSLWYLNTNWNILNTGFADMQAFFDFTPWLLLLLIPAIGMRMFSEEYTSGTIEILKTKPLRNFAIVLGKFWAALFLVFISLLPTWLYAFSISVLSKPANIDWGVIFSSFLGLLLLSSVFVAIGLLTSIFFKNQILAFLSSVLISFLLFYGFELWANWYMETPILLQKMGLVTHYRNISKGVLSSTDIVFFASLSLLFLWITKINLDT